MSLGRWSALLGVVGFVLGALGSWRPSFWYDEAATVFSATRPLPDLLRLLQHQDAVHGLYYLGMHFWLRVFGASEVVARLPSAIAVGVATAGVVLLGGRLTSLRVGLASGLLFLVMPRVTWAAVEARDLALTAALSVWLSVLLLAAVWHNGIRWWLGYLVVAVVSVAVFLPSALLVVAHAVTLGWRRESRSVLVSFGIAALGVAVLSAPVVWFLQRQSGQVAWIPPLDTGTVRAVLEYQWFVGAPIFAVIFLVVLLVGAVAGRMRGPVVSLALPWAVLPTGVLLAYSVLVAPYYLDRYRRTRRPLSHCWAALRRWRWAGSRTVDSRLGAVRRRRCPADCRGTGVPCAARSVVETERDGLRRRGVVRVVERRARRVCGLRRTRVVEPVVGASRAGGLSPRVRRPARRLARPVRAPGRVALGRDPPTRSHRRPPRHLQRALVRHRRRPRRPQNHPAHLRRGVEVPAYHFRTSPDYAALQSQGFTVTDTYPLHMSQVWRLRHP